MFGRAGLKSLPDRIWSRGRSLPTPKPFCEIVALRLPPFLPKEEGGVSVQHVNASFGEGCFQVKRPADGQAAAAVAR